MPQDFPPRDRAQRALNGHYNEGAMTGREYAKLVAAQRVRENKTIAACRAVLVDGLTAYAVAAKHDLAESVISRALGRLRRPRCPTCGQPLRGRK